MGGEHDRGKSLMDAVEEGDTAVVAIVGLLDAAMDGRRHAEGGLEPGLASQVCAAHDLDPSHTRLCRHTRSGWR